MINIDAIADLPRNPRKPDPAPGLLSFNATALLNSVDSNPSNLINPINLINLINPVNPLYC